MAVLIVEATKQKIPLEQAALTIGSGDKSMIQIQDPKLGALHCQIIKNGGAFRIISLDQNTGTFINGIKVKDQQLKGGDVIQLGATKLIFQDDGAPKATQAVARPVTQAVARPATQTGVQRPPSQPVRQPTQAIAKPVTKAIPTGTQPVARPATQTGLQKPPTGGVKMPTQAVARPGTQPVRSPTQAIQKPATQKSVTQRGKPTGRNTKRGSRSTITAAKIEMHKKHIPIGVKVFGTCALVIAAGIGLFFLIRDTSDKEVEEFSMKAGKMHIEAQKLVDEKKYDEAVKQYDLIFGMTGGLSSKAKEKIEGTLVVYRGEKRRVDDLKKASGGQLKKIQKWIEEAQAIKADFKLDSASPFIYKSDWITKTDHEEAKALYKELETMRDAATAAILSWPKEQIEFDKLIKDRDYPKAKQFIDDFMKKCKDAAEVAKAKTAEETILPYAKEHVGRVKSAIIKKKEGAKIEDLKKEWDEAVEKHFKGIVPPADLDKAWNDILTK
jgi:pSer/pThr/pTyr-binding forkhead associated (FHA) protein